MSSDDIVERLHVWADLVAGNEPLMSPVLTVDLRHTADEIERLRGEVDSWRYWSAVTEKAIRDAADDLWAQRPSDSNLEADDEH